MSLNRPANIFSLTLFPFLSSPASGKKGLSSCLWGLRTAPHLLLALWEPPSPTTPLSGTLCRDVSPLLLQGIERYPSLSHLKPKHFCTISRFSSTLHPLSHFLSLSSFWREGGKSPECQCFSSAGNPYPLLSGFFPTLFHKPLLDGVVKDRIVAQI